MSDVYDAVVWVDHSEAKIFRFGSDHVPVIHVHSHASLQRLHHRQTGWEAGGNVTNDTEFFKRVFDAVGNARGTVITGPGNAKTALKTYLDHARPEESSRVFAVETLEPPEADAMLALGRRYFKRSSPPDDQARTAGDFGSTQ